MISPLPPMLPESPDAPSSHDGRWWRRSALLLLVAGTGGGLVWWFRSTARASGPSVSAVGTAYAAERDTMAQAPKGVRVRVRVLNTTNTRGLAKRATQLLRDRGFDVVDYDTDQRTPLKTTMVQTHSGHSDWSDRVVRVLGVGTVTSRPDTSRYIDLTVLIGRDWHAPSQPFRP